MNVKDTPAKYVTVLVQKNACIEVIFLRLFRAGWVAKRASSFVYVLFTLPLSHGGYPARKSYYEESSLLLLNNQILEIVFTNVFNVLFHLRLRLIFFSPRSGLPDGIFSDQKL
jgi:hypothetical protein